MGHKGWMFHNEAADSPDPFGFALHLWLGDLGKNPMAGRPCAVLRSKDVENKFCLDFNLKQISIYLKDMMCFALFMPRSGDTK